MTKIKVEQAEINIINIGSEDYISLTDMAKHKSDEPSAVIGNWMRNRNTIEYLGLWEILYNPNFKPIEFEGFRRQAGLNAFTLSPQKWIRLTNALGMVCKSGRYGGTYAHKDIALKFAAWISVQWRDANPELVGNIRDYATINQLICLSNLENLNSVFITEGLPQSERLIKLNHLAIHQMQILEAIACRKTLK